MALGGCSATPKGQKNFNFLIFLKNLALGGGSATPKGQTHFKNKCFFALGGGSCSGFGHPRPASLRWLKPPYGSTWVAGHLIVLSFILIFYYFSWPV
jgi:hypothetical protein